MFIQQTKRAFYDSNGGLERMDIIRIIKKRNIQQELQKQLHSQNIRSQKNRSTPKMVTYAMDNSKEGLFQIIRIVILLVIIFSALWLIYLLSARAISNYRTANALFQDELVNQQSKTSSWQFVRQQSYQQYSKMQHLNVEQLIVVYLQKIEKDPQYSLLDLKDEMAINQQTWQFLVYQISKKINCQSIHDKYGELRMNCSLGK